MMRFLWKYLMNWFERRPRKSNTKSPSGKCICVVPQDHLTHLEQNFQWEELLVKPCTLSKTASWAVWKHSTFNKSFIFYHRHCLYFKFPVLAHRKSFPKFSFPNQFLQTDFINSVFCDKSFKETYNTTIYVIVLGCCLSVNSEIKQEHY